MTTTERRRYDGHFNENGKHKDSKYDDPPHSRLFIVCGKNITDEDFRQSFSKFGSIEEVWIVRDKVTDEPKGVTYIKFTKTSEAALAMEEMNGKCIGNHPRPLKVLIAHSRDQGSKRDPNEEERLLRLFVVVPKTMTEVELREHFKEFGDIEYASVVKDRVTKENPKPTKDSVRYDEHRVELRNGDAFGSGYPGGIHLPPHNNNFIHHSPFEALAYLDTGSVNPEGATKLTIICSSSLNQDQLWKLFDLVPGLDYCDLRKDRKFGQGRGVATAVYNNVQSASYARLKLHGFEYPPGERLIVKFESSHQDISPNPAVIGGNATYGLPRMSNPFPTTNGTVVSPTGNMGSGNPIGNGSPSKDLAAQLAETLAQATSIIQAAGLTQGGNLPILPNNNTQASVPETYDPYYCSVKLPPPQPLAPVDSLVAESPPQIFALKDVFGRFGNLIDVYMLSGKSFGYAKYASKESAEKAIMTLHGQEIMGSRLKVMQADPQERSDPARKRLKTAEQE